MNFNIKIDDIRDKVKTIKPQFIFKPGPTNIFITKEPSFDVTLIENETEGGLFICGSPTTRRPGFADSIGPLEGIKTSYPLVITYASHYTNYVMKSGEDGEGWRTFLEYDLLSPCGSSKDIKGFINIFLEKDEDGKFINKEFRNVIGNKAETSHTLKFK